MKSVKRAFVIGGAVLGFTAMVAGVAVAGGECPQTRITKKAPDAIFNAKNPKTSAEDIAAGKELFQKNAKPMACKMCHGTKGEGNGIAGKAFNNMKNKHVRNFTCKETMKDIPAGQMFNVIKNGSSPMMAFGKMMKDDQIWQIISYVRSELATK